VGASHTSRCSPTSLKGRPLPDVWLHNPKPRRGKGRGKGREKIGEGGLQGDRERIEKR
jgi:hypothetical protein